MSVPTNLTWIDVKDCICKNPLDVCVRPNVYTKPILCVPAALCTQFPNLLSLNTNNTLFFALILLVLIRLVQLLLLFFYSWSLFVKRRRLHRATRNFRQVQSSEIRRPTVHPPTDNPVQKKFLLGVPKGLL
ncbi:hypothetical protein GPALN_009784 [Globodera pallida]|nr:hypothetical protein GPALN_009784 [Globodera pallida]